MSAMGRLFEDLTLNWTETETGYIREGWAIVRQSDGQVDLFTNPTGAVNGWIPVLTGKLHAAVHYVIQNPLEVLA